MIGRVHGAERGERGVWGNGLATDVPGPRDREREGAHGEENWHRQAGPTGQQVMEGGSTRGRIVADRWGPPVRRRGRAAWLGRLG
jgi:hypothetical protein